MMKHVRLILTVFVLSASFVMTVVFQTFAAGPLVSKPGNKHNLSASNTGVTYRAKSLAVDPTNVRGQEICIFCHTPHNANVEGGAPLWNRKFSTQVFQRYSGSTLFVIKNNSNANYGTAGQRNFQPDGSSKLCLSCHDGVSSLGAVKNGSPIAMVSDVITGFASFNPADAANKMRYGHHPISFVYDGSVASAINLVKGAGSYKFPPSLSAVKLDRQGKMQCTTCHNAHQNQSDDNAFYSSPNDTRKIAPFWVYGAGGAATASDDQQSVCLACHPMNAGAVPALATPGLWP